MKGRSVSVLTVVRNGVSTLENCILSVMGQTHPLVEHVIVDGGSTDGTLDILDKYSARINWASGPDRGLFDAMNKGIARARNDWILFVGSDDLLASPQALEQLIGQCPADLSPYGVLTGHALYEDGRLYRSNRPDGLRWRNCIHHQGALYDRSLFDDRPFDIGLKTYADYEFNIRLWQEDARFFHTSQLLCILGVGGMSDRPKWSAYREDMRVRARYIRGRDLWLGHALAVARYAYKLYWHRNALRNPAKQN